LKVRWTRDAERDRATILDWIAAEDLRAAVRMDALFGAAAARLAAFPMLGRSGLIAGTRELIPHESYRMVYEIRNDTVWILALIHTARLWPPLPEE